MKRCLSTRHPSRNATIDMAPLIDMVFLLLIFYIVSASFTQDSAVRINRPESNVSRKISEEVLPVAITKSGLVQVAGQSISSAGRKVIAAAVKRAGCKNVLVYADREVPTGTLLRVMDACREGGAKNINVAATARKGL